jgi:hypothetical protein
MANEEVDMHGRQSSSTLTPPVGSSHSEARASELPPVDDDAGLLALEIQFNGLIAELFAAQTAIGGLSACPCQSSPREDDSKASVETKSELEAGTKEVETILARLDPIEQGIMQTSARTIAGLGVKARHAAYVMSQHWEMPIDRIDWDARATRLLIEAVCNVAHVPLPISEAASDDEL